MQSGSVLPNASLTAVFLSAKPDTARLEALIHSMKQVASELTVVLTDSTTARSSVNLSSERLFFIKPSSDSNSSDLREAVRNALEVSPTSERFLVFVNEGIPIPSLSELLKFAKRSADFLSPSELGCMMMSNRYAAHIVASGESPSVRNAIQSGFSAPMSPLQMILSPKDAIRQNAMLARFMLVGASGVAVNLVLLALLKSLTGALVANALSNEMSIISNFIWNDVFTFRRSSVDSFDKGKLTRLIKYNGISLVSLSVNEAIFYLVYSRLGMWYISSAVVAIGAAFLINYIGSSRWAWGSPHSKSIVKD
ncbi:MAG: GtrA family protein [Nitrososphaerales archaeon]